jgi:zinc/manganese transport system substrate-binding protein
MKRLFLTLILALAAMAAHAEVRVVATVPNMGMLAEAVGGDAVQRDRAGTARS